MMIRVRKMSNSCSLTFDLSFAPTSGAKVNAARLHETPLHHAAKNMRVEMIEILVEFGANVYARDQHNRKPVYYTTPGSPSAGCLSFYESKSRSSDRFPQMDVEQVLFLLYWCQKSDSLNQI